MKLTEMLGQYEELLDRRISWPKTPRTTMQPSIS